MTEQEREHMSLWLITTAPPKSTNRLLSQIDEEVEKSVASDGLQVSFGPFGAFKVNHGTPVVEISDSLRPVEEPDNIDKPSLDVDQMIDSFSLDDGVPQWSSEFMQSLLEQPSQNSNSPSPNLLDLFTDRSQIEDSLLPSEDEQPSELIPSIHNAPIPPITLDPASVVLPAVPQDALFLLKHYASTVINLMTPVRHQKTPWHILFVPHAKNCLAALALGENISHASLCSFYGTLSMSAFSLGGALRSQSWLDQGRTYLRHAQEHAKAMLMTAYDTVKAAKYKSILMAILTMVQVSNFCGNRHQAEGYFLEAEKFIRMKGLKRRKSRKVRLLHHCYVFERLFHESIFICGANSNQRCHIRKAIESSGLAPASVDGLSFRLYKWKNLHQEMLRVRDREEGENDLHLERPGLFFATLYPEIFGVPEPWLVLLSSVIRLGTEKDGAVQDNPDALNLRDFISRAKNLEDYINQLQRPNAANPISTDHQPLIDQHILENMLEAVQHALAIYFYRRIYNLSASMLQDKVVKVRDCLHRCQDSDPSVVHGSAGFVWPAFIAACEAEDPKIQDSFLTWFEISGRRSGFS